MNTISVINALGQFAIGAISEFGAFGVFSIRVLKVLVTTQLKIEKVFAQALYIGVNSLSVVALTGATVGGVLALQSYEGLNRFGAADRFVGPLIFLSMVREFGPILSAVMVTGRAGSAMTAEIGSMKISEQLDALKTLNINTFQYLISPRIVASTIILPFLSIFCSICGITVGYLISIYVLGINSDLYVESIRAYVAISDITNGLIQATVFGFLLSMIGCYKGYYTDGGARGVGIATTESVVYACVTIFTAGYILSAFMFGPS